MLKARPAVDQTEVKDALEVALGWLSQTQRKYITLYHLEHHTIREVSLLMGVSESWAQRVLTKAMSKMRLTAVHRNL